MNFDIFKEKVLDYFSDDPNFCVSMGISKNLGQLPDPGKNKLIQKQGKLRLLEKLLGGIDSNLLSQDGKLDLKLISLLIERENVHYELEIDGVLEIFKKPNAADTIIHPLFTFLLNDDRDPSLRLVNIVSRLRKIPEYLSSMQRNIRLPLKRWANIEISSMESLGELFDSIKSFAVENKFKNMAILEDALNKSAISVKTYIEFLKNTDKSSNLHLGLEQAKRVIASNGIDLTVEEMHALATKFTRENIEQINKYASALKSKYELAQTCSNEELQEFLNEKYKVDSVLKEYEDEKLRIREFIKENHISPLLEDDEIVIIKTPSFMKNLIPAGAMCAPLPFKKGTKKSLVFLTIDEGNSADHNLLTIPSMMVHEGIPGHHLQFANAANHKSDIRKIFMANELSEGWATYLEEYIIELGLRPTLKDELYFIIKRDMARIGARVAIDLYFMIGDEKYLDIGVDFDSSSTDPFEKAKSLLIAVTGFSEARADGELNWYSMERGYPMTYLIGNVLMKDLKRRSKKSDYDFHKFILAQGNLPISLISI